MSDNDWFNPLADLDPLRDLKADLNPLHTLEELDVNHKPHGRDEEEKKRREKSGKTA